MNFLKARFKAQYCHPMDTPGSAVLENPVLVHAAAELGSRAGHWQNSWYKTQRLSRCKYNTKRRMLKSQLKCILFCPNNFTLLSPTRYKTVALLLSIKSEQKIKSGPSDEQSPLRKEKQHDIMFLTLNHICLQDKEFPSSLKYVPLLFYQMLIHNAFHSVGAEQDFILIKKSKGYW